ncbi:pirin family protein [Aeromicrobium sp.]|uniref:pirin family protein n=1 Tax=Aeromicrobium sp. TaxID=1871063 RepID=UPI0019AD153C|nr:pirin family protein [Aeromicrobium sp.]MBC7630253.1 pirin family protein [Aeromicrobium sp.]
MIEIHRAGDRFCTVGEGVSTWHSFSYGAHYDPANVGFGPIVAINTEHVEAGQGYEAHRHADVEIVTWVLQGVLRHDDSTGHSGTIRVGTAQRLSAGTGVEHSERNASTEVPLAFVQMMLVSEREGEPEYVQREVVPGTGLVPTVAVHAPAELFVVRLAAGDIVTVPASRRSLIHVTAGSIQLDDNARHSNTVLQPGDEARLTAAGEYDLRAIGAADALIWQLQR